MRTRFSTGSYVFISNHLRYVDTPSFLSGIQVQVRSMIAQELQCEQQSASVRA